MSSNSSLPADSNDDYQQAYALALRLLARREHSLQELYHKLKGRQCPTTVVDEVLAELVAEGALSDRRFAGVYVQSRFERGFGPLRIQAELRERGIGDTQIEQALADFQGQWTDSACRQRQKRFGDTAAGDFNQRVKQMRFLQQRGFSTDQIRAAMKNTGDALNSMT
jgi:regulatory protein